MMEMKRKITMSDYKIDFISVVSSLILRYADSARRISLNPLGIHDTVYSWLQDDMLTPEFVSTYIQIQGKEVVIVGMILPKKMLAVCFESLTKRQVKDKCQINPCTFMARFIDSQIEMVILCTEQQEYQSNFKSGIAQKIIYDLSLLIVTTEDHAKNKVHYFETRDLEDQIFQKEPSILLIKTQQLPISQNLVKKLQKYFWTVEEMSIEEAGKKVSLDSIFGRSFRRSYNTLVDEAQQETNLSMKVKEVLGVSLKRNWKHSNNLVSCPFLYFLVFYIKGSIKQTKIIVQKSLKEYRDVIEAEFTNFLKQSDSLKQPIDELRLRKMISNERRTIQIKFKKNLKMFQRIVLENDYFNRIVDDIKISFDKLEKEVYKKNNQKAQQFNLQLLKKLYIEQIDKHFEVEGSVERNLLDFQSDFKAFLDIYGNQGIRVVSQLKTFNNFIMEKKTEYTKNLERYLRGSKRTLHEKQEINNRIQIQTNILQTLDLQMKQLQQKRSKIDEVNDEYKKIIQKSRKQQRDILLSERISQAKIDKANDTGQTKRQLKLKSKTNKKIEKQNKEKKCCCQIM